MPLKVPASLVRHLNGGRCVLFVGAGLSAQAKLPSWGKLLGDLVQQVGADETDEGDTAELQRLLDAGRYLDVADECKERLGAGYAELLSRALQVGPGPVPEAHRLVMQLPFAAWITTNYDKLLEQAHFQVRGSVPKTLTHLDADTFGTLLFDGAPFILKAHGDVDKPESLIFTTRDYREIIHSNPAFQAVFSAILLTRAVLFVGYSLNDPDFRLLLDRQLTTFKKFVPERYAIMAGVGEVEREVLRRTAQIKVISYPADQHEQLVEFLRALQAQVATNRNEKASLPEVRASGSPVAPGRRDVGASTKPKAHPTQDVDRGERAASARGEESDAIAALLEEAGQDAGGALDAKAVPPQPQAPPGGGGRGSRRSNPMLGAVFSAPPAQTKPPPPASAPHPPPPVTAPAPTKPAGSGGPMARPASAAPPTRAVLSLTTQAHRTVATLSTDTGEIIAGGAGLPATGRLLSRLLSQARTVPEYQAIGASIAAQVHAEVLQALERMARAGAWIDLDLSSDLESLPWELLDVGDSPLALQAAVSRAPVGLTQAARGRPMFREPVHALLVGDPTGNLPGARAEVEEIARLYHKPVVLIGDDATAENITDVTLRGCHVIHFAGHAWYDAQDVYLVLAEGVHLTDDLIRPGLSHRPPCVVMLNSHYTAFVPPGVGSKGPDPMKATSAGRMGFTDVLMQAGVGAFVGCFGSPSDDGAAAVAVAFHRALLSGVPAAQALHRARNAPTVREDDPTPLLYSLSGYGDLALE